MVSYNLESVALPFVFQGSYTKEIEKLLDYWFSGSREVLQTQLVCVWGDGFWFLVGFFFFCN